MKDNTAMIVLVMVGLVAVVGALMLMSTPSAAPNLEYAASLSTGLVPSYPGYVVEQTPTKIVVRNPAGDITYYLRFGRVYHVAKPGGESDEVTLRYDGVTEVEHSRNGKVVCKSHYSDQGKLMASTC